MAHSRGVAAKLHGDLTTFLGKVLEYLEVAKSLAMLLQKKIGEAFSEALQAGGLDIPACLSASAQTKEFLLFICDYIVDVAFLIPCTPMSLEASEMLTLNVDYMQHLTKFCAAHRQLLSTATIDLNIAPEFSSVVHSIQFEKFVSALVSGPGDVIFNRHAMPSVTSAITWLEARVLRFNPVEARAFENHKKVCLWKINHIVH